MTTQLLNDRWYSREFPVLLAIAGLLDEQPMYPVRVEDVEKRTGLPSNEVQAASRALLDAGYIEGLVGDGRIMRYKTISGEARRLTGLWPTPESALERLIAAIEQQMATATPDQRRALTRMKDGLADLPQQIGVGIAMAAAGGLIG